MGEILRIENLAWKTGGRNIFSSVSFSVEEGSFTLLCGRNGAGKSQLLKTLKGLQNPSEGKILLRGEDVSKDRNRRLHALALVFQDADVQSVGETVEKDIEFGPENLGWPSDRIIAKREEVIALLGLEAKRKQRPATLSGGEKRKLAIAGVLAMEPEVILLDEPFANLDYPSTVTVIETLLTLHRKGHTLIIVSHEAEKFLAHTDRVLILKEGSLIFDGPSRESMEALRAADVYLPRLPFEELSWLAQ